MKDVDEHVHTLTEVKTIQHLHLRIFGCSSGIRHSEITESSFNVLGVDSCLVFVVGAVALIFYQLRGKYPHMPGQTVFTLSIHPPVLQSLLL